VRAIGDHGDPQAEELGGRMRTMAAGGWRRVCGQRGLGLDSVGRGARERSRRTAEPSAAGRRPRDGDRVAGMTHPAGLLGRIALDAAALMRTHPPRWQHPKKQALFDHVCPPGSVHAGTITVARWAEQALPLAARWSERPLDGELRADVFQYTPRTGRARGPRLAPELRALEPVPGLWGAAAGPGRAAMVEHPVLGAVRECLREQTDPGLQPLTREQERATPVLLRGVERRCALDTSTLYGNAFARASVAAIVAATRVLRPPTISNILAMEAPIGGSGYYAVRRSRTC
jgi:hypothetical protein